MDGGSLSLLGSPSPPSITTVKEPALDIYTTKCATSFNILTELSCLTSGKNNYRFPVVLYIDPLLLSPFCRREFDGQGSAFKPLSRATTSTGALDSIETLALQSRQVPMTTPQTTNNLFDQTKVSLIAM